MKKLSLITIAMSFVLFAQAQLFIQDQGPGFKKLDGTVLELALAGGMNQPQFSQMHLNGDTLLDLLVFDRSGDKLSCFIALKDNSTIRYAYAPEYEVHFPVRDEFMFFQDYDGDGKQDLWSHDPYTGKIQLHRNTTGSTISFEFVKNLRAYNFNNPPFDTSDFVQYKGNYPDVVDLDGDGDLDFVTNTAYCGSNITYYRNTTAERGLPRSKIRFDLVDYCLGNVGEDGVTVVIDAPCFFQKHYKKKHCGIKTLCFFDNDADGDLDLFFGTSEQPTDPLYFVENGKSDLSWPYDTFIGLDSAYFPAAVEPLIPVAPGSSLVDIDLDGILDLILSTNEVLVKDYPVQETHNVLYFRNNGQTNQPDFQFQTEEFMVGDMVDHGGHTAPALADLNGDGLLDLLIATNGDDAITNNEAHYVVYYRNIGSKTSPIFQLSDSDLLQLRTENLAQFNLSLGDLDGDGDQDALLGMQDGSLRWVENIGSAMAPQFAASTGGYMSIDVGEFAAPYICDLDRDGLLDLVIGEYEGNVNYYRNTGSKTAPSFELITDSLGYILTNELVKKTYFDPDRGLYDTLEYVFYGNSSLALAHMEDDSLYLIAGGADGHVRAYRVANNLSDSFPCDSDFLRTVGGGQNYSKDWGALSKVCAGDITGDQVDDLFIGTNRGGIYFLKGLQTGSVARRYRSAQFKLHPNPTAGSLEVGIAEAGLEYRIMDLQGRCVQSGKLSSQHVDLSDHLANGIYWLHIHSTEREYLPQKFVIQR